MSDSSTDPYIGRTFGPCRIEKKLAVGGYGVVYQAVDNTLGIPRAVKVFHPHVSREPEFRGRFQNEVRLMAQLDHPNIVKIVYAIVEEDVSGFVMEFVAGEEIGEYLEKSEQIELPECFQIMTQVLRAIEYAHSLDPPVIHRDLSPDNLLRRSDGQVKIMDFGIAKTINSEKLTQTGVVLGKPCYMAPEQFEGQVTTATDQYALGVIFYELLTGDIPFEGESPVAQYKARFQQEVKFSAEDRSRLPESIQAIILKSLAQDADDRYASISEMLSALESELGSNASLQNAAAPTPKSSLPPEAREHYEAGVLALQRADYVGAKEAFGRVLEIAPDHPDAAKHRDFVQKELEHQQLETRQNVNMAREITTTLNTGKDLLMAGESGEAARHFRRVLNWNENHTEAHQLLSECKRAIEDQDRREQISLFYSEGISFYENRKFSEATRCFDKVLECFGGHKGALDHRSKCQDLLQNKDQVDSLQREGLELFHGANYEAALSRFENILELDPENPEAQKYRNLSRELIYEESRSASGPSVPPARRRTTNQLARPRRATTQSSRVRRRTTQSNTQPGSTQWILPATIGGVVLIALVFIIVRSFSSDSVATNLNPSPAPSTPQDPKKRRAEKVDKATEAFRNAITSKRVRKATQALQEAIQAAGTQRALLEELQGFLALPGRVEWLLDTDPKTHSDLLVKIFGKNAPFLDQLSGKFSEKSQGYLKSKKYEKARKAASRALLLNDADMEARKSRSLANFGEEQYLDAIPDLEILRKQHQSELLFHLAICYLRTQKLEKARQTVEEFRQATPENPDGYRLRAKILIEQGDFRGAILDLQEVMKLDNPNGVARFKILQMLSKAHYGLGDLWLACLHELEAVKFANKDYARGQHPQQLTDLLNGHLAKLQTSPRLPYDLDFRVMPPTGNLQSRVQVAFPWPNDHQWKNRDNLWGLRMFIGGQSAFEARFQLSSSEIARGVRLRLDHVSTNRPDGLRDGRISLWINNSLIEKDKNLCGKAEDPYQLDITKMCKPGNNSLKIRFAEKSQTQYWLRRVQISSR